MFKWLKVKGHARGQRLVGRRGLVHGQVPVSGQGLVEFALILPALLLILFSIIEGAFLFQAYLAIQHAAREGARYAVNYQPPQTYSIEQGELLLKGLLPKNETPAFAGETTLAWYARRADYIRERAILQAVGLQTKHIANGNDVSSVPQFGTFMPAGESYDTTWLKIREPGFIGSRVIGFQDQAAATSGIPSYNHPSLPGLPVQVQVFYCWAPFDPIIGAIVKAATPNGCVLLTGSATMINEGVQVGLGAIDPPTFPSPQPPPGATPTATGGTPGTPGTPVQTSTPTLTPTPPTPTATPNYPYILLDPKQDRWLWEEWDTTPGTAPKINIELYNHPSGPTYQFFWNDSCGGNDINLGHSTTTSASGYAVEPVRAPRWTVSGADAANYQDGQFTYLSLRCGAPPAPGTTFTATLKTKTLVGASYVEVASIKVPIYVPYRRPDLIITDIITSTTGVGGNQLRVGVVLSNTEAVDAFGTFDIDIYVNPPHEPVLKGLPGLGTAGSGDTPPKRWQTDGLPQLSSTTIWYVLTLPPTGKFSIWAQVDTSDLIDERDNENNIFGPEEFEYPCSDNNDTFDGPPTPIRGTLDSEKWQPLAALGTYCTGSGSAFMMAGESLVIEGSGCSVFNTNDGHYFFLHQGPQTDDFDMRIQVLGVPNRAGAKSGLMVRESLDSVARYVAFGVGKTADNTGYWYQFWERLGSGTATERTACRATIPSDRFAGDNPPGVWLRIVKEGNKITQYTSMDGEDWITDATCMQVIIDGGFSAYYPGIAMLPY